MNEATKRRWTLRFDLWRAEGESLGPMISGLGRLWMMRSAFEIKSPMAYWSMVATDAIEVAVHVASAHRKVETFIRDMEDANDDPAGDDNGAEPAPTTTATATQWVSVRVAAIAPIAATSPDELRAERVGRKGMLGVLSSDEARIENALATARARELGGLVETERWMEGGEHPRQEALVTVRAAAVEPFTERSPEKLTDQLNERRRKLAPVSREESRLMHAVRALRRLAIINSEGGA